MTAIKHRRGSFRTHQSPDASIPRHEAALCATDGDPAERRTKVTDDPDCGVPPIRPREAKEGDKNP